MLLAPDPDRLLLIRRADRVGDPWAGHLALPGGRRDPVDIDLRATAIRETEEEIGVPLIPAMQRATLDDQGPITPVIPPILVRPFVFEVGQLHTFTLSDEVTAVAWVELARLNAPGTYRNATISVQGSIQVMQGYHLYEGLLWGMTERIVTPLLRRWEALRRSGR